MNLTPLYALALLLLIGYFSYKKVQNSTLSKANEKRTKSMVFMKIKIPKKDSREDKETESDSLSGNRDFKDQLNFMKQFYESMHSLVETSWKKNWYGQDYFSMELVVSNTLIDFYIVCPKHLALIIEKQLTSFYPDTYVEFEEDYKFYREGMHYASAYVHLEKESILPIRTYQKMESDPFNSVSNILSKLDAQESAVIQMVIAPEPDDWQEEGRQKAKDILEDKATSSFWSEIKPLDWTLELLHFIFKGKSEEEDSSPVPSRSNQYIEDQARDVESKSLSVGFDTVIRLHTRARVEQDAKDILTGMKTAFSQYASTINNRFSFFDKNLGDFAYDFLCRNLNRPKKVSKMILSPEELTSILHLPNIRFNRSPVINWQNYKIAPPPINLPTEGILLGHNIYRGIKKEVRMKRDDRFRHFYVIGQTGTGKSSILQVMIRQDLQNNQGVCVMDPHGQLIDDILPFIPRERADDVIYFNPADLERPLGLNLLEASTPEERDSIALEAMNIMIKLFDEEIFGPRIQDYFRNGCLTLMESPEGGALTDIVRLFTDDEFQREKTKHVKNPVVRSFWENQMANTGAREKQEMIPYFAAKFGAFVTNGLMRNIIGQTKSAFSFSQVMDEGKILLVNLSKGETGDLNSKLLGMIIVAKLQQAALARQRMPKEQRRDFFMYIDEFQNYVTDSIEVILSEARKYRLSLNMAHQYLAQLDESGGRKGGANLKDAVFGNVGSIMSYKIGAQDAEYMAKEMAPVFSDQDLINVDKYKAVMKLSIDTQPSKPFSIIPLNPYTEQGDLEAAEAYIQLSRLKYGRDKTYIEREIFRRMGAVF